MTKKERVLLYELMEYDINRYLIVNSFGREDGVEKFDRHARLVMSFLVWHWEVPSYDGMVVTDLFDEIHNHTQQLTSYLDTAIGFPLDTRPDYDDLVPKFFDEFIELCLEYVE